MPLDVLVRGIPIPSLVGRAREIGAQLDTSRRVAREDASHIDSDHVERDEARAAMRALGTWTNPGDRAIVEEFATALGALTEPTDDEVDGSVVNDIDVILTTITRTAGVSAGEAVLDVDVDMLSYQNLGKNQIAFDIDANFFCRPSWNGQSLMSVGEDADGKRYLFGVPRDGRSALPKNTELWLCHPASGHTLALQTDGDGRFAAELPAEMIGSAYIVRADEQDLGAQIELP